MASILDIIVRQKKEGRAIKQTEKEAKGLGKTIKSLGIGFAAVGGAALAAGALMKKAFDLGREGAVVAQTAESFDLLIDSIGASTDLLEELRVAARGTVDDTQLMSSTMTLLAGASDDLAPALANATPKLLEIAKAANKLNPALGDTTFLYQSIATGVKRAQPLILDNLGLTIKVGAANEAMARQLGKTVEELTAEEKAMAILNDTLRAGEILISQVGGSTDAAGDAYAQLTTELKNASDAGKVWLDEFLRPVIKTMGSNMKAQRLLREQVDLGTISQERYMEIVLEMRRGVIDASEAIEFAEEKMRENTVATEANIAAIDGWQIALLPANQAGHELAETLDDIADSDLSPLGQQFADAKTKLDLARQASDNYFGSINTGLLSAIAGFKEQNAFIAAGGLKVQSAFKEIAAARDAFLITPDEATQALRDVEQAALAVAVQTGQISMKDAIAQMRDEYNVSWREAKSIIQASIDLVDAIPFITEKRIEFFVEFTGAPLPGGKHGLDMTVPAGFPNDSFPILASSGERVQITPAGATTNNTSNTNNLFAGSTFVIGNEMDLAQFEDMLREVLG